MKGFGLLHLHHQRNQQTHKKNTFYVAAVANKWSEMLQSHLKFIFFNKIQSDKNTSLSITFSGMEMYLYGILATVRTVKNTVFKKKSFLAAVVFMDYMVGRG